MDKTSALLYVSLELLQELHELRQRVAMLEIQLAVLQTEPAR